MGVDLATIDVVIIVLYALGSIGLGVALGRNNHDAEDYFLAGRNMRWPVIGSSLYASNISTTTLVGLAGAAYTAGIAVYNYEWMAVLALVGFALFFVRPVLRSGVYTMPEFLDRRYGPRVRTYFALLTLFLNIVVDTAGSLFAGAVLFELVFPAAPFWLLIVVLALAAGLYTVVGGLAAVMVTDAIQAVILTVAAAIIFVFALDEVGGWTALIDTIERTTPEKLSLIRPLDDPHLPWFGLVLGVPILGFYFWCTNQFMIQRVLAARDETEGRLGMLFAGFLKLPTLFFMVLPGTAAIVLYPNLESANDVYPTLLFDLMPHGLLGLALAGFVAALMSQIDSTLSSASTLVTMDFIRPWRPDLTPQQLMRVGQGATLVFMGFAVLWAPQIQRFPDLFSYLQAVLAYAVGPVVALFGFGVLWKRANTTGAEAAIVVGGLTGAVLFYGIQIAGWPLHFLYAAPLGMAASSVALVVGSLWTSPPPSERVEGLVWTPDQWADDARQLAGQPWYRDYRVLSGLLVALTVAIVVAFA
ncbi:MAG: sodium:solute symporter [Myxococcota bacterium]